MIKTILYNVLSAFGQAFGYSLLLAVLFMFFYMQCNKDGLKSTLAKWVREFKEKKDFRKVFLLAFYAALVLFRTLFNRFAWTNPLQNVIGIFGLYNANGELTTEAIENIILFIPLIFLWLWVVDKQEVTLIITLSFAVKNALLCSFLIEMAQLLLRVGQVQISDLVYNTLGGIIGGVCYWTTIWVKKKAKQQ